MTDDLCTKPNLSPRGAIKQSRSGSMSKTAEKFHDATYGRPGDKFKPPRRRKEAQKPSELLFFFRQSAEKQNKKVTKWRKM